MLTKPCGSSVIARAVAARSGESSPSCGIPPGCPLQLTHARIVHSWMNYLVLKFMTEGMPRMKSIERANGSAEFRWLSIVGTRPQFVKLAPVCRAIEAHNENAGSRSIHHTIVNTGQHYDREVAELFFEQMKISQPPLQLAVGLGL